MVSTAPTDTIAADILPYRSKELRVPGKESEFHGLRYLDEGHSSDGSGPLVCVHGNPTWSFYYRRIVERFSPTRRVIAIDHIGCGRSDKPSSDRFDYQLTQHRDNVVRLVDDQDLHDATLIAHDWGGAIGLAAVLERPERFSRIVLLNTAAFPPPYIPWRIAACRWPIVGTPAVRGLNLFAKAAVTMAMSRKRLSRDDARGLLAPYDSWENRVAIDAFVRDIPMSRNHPTHAVLEQLENNLSQLAKLPILIVWGMKDWCFRPECLRRFQSTWPHAKVVEIPDAGHYVLEDATDDTLAAIEQFLAETDK